MPITAIGVVSSASIVMLRGALGSCARGLRVSVRKRNAAVISWFLLIYILPTCVCRVGRKYKPACDFDFALMSTQEGYAQGNLYPWNVTDTWGGPRPWDGGIV